MNPLQRSRKERAARAKVRLRVDLSRLWYRRLRACESLRAAQSPVSAPEGSEVPEDLREEKRSTRGADGAQREGCEHTDAEVFVGDWGARWLCVCGASGTEPPPVDS